MSKARCILNVTNVINLYLYQLCLRVIIAPTLAKALGSNYYDGKIFGKILKVEGVPPNYFR